MILTIKKPYPFEHVNSQIDLEGSVDISKNLETDYSEFRIITYTYPSIMQAHKEIPIVNMPKKKWTASITLDKKLINTPSPTQYHRIKIFACTTKCANFIDNLVYRFPNNTLDELPEGCKEIASVFIIILDKKSENTYHEAQKIRNELFHTRTSA